MRLPSGDQAGSISCSPPTLVMWTTCEGSIERTTTRVVATGSGIANATRVPSGESCGRRSAPGSDVIVRLALTVHACAAGAAAVAPLRKCAITIAVAAITTASAAAANVQRKARANRGLGTTRAGTGASFALAASRGSSTMGAVSMTTALSGPSSTSTGAISR